MGLEIEKNFGTVIFTKLAQKLVKIDLAFKIIKYLNSFQILA